MELSEGIKEETEGNPKSFINDHCYFNFWGSQVGDDSRKTQNKDFRFPTEARQNVAEVKDWEK